MPDSGREAVRPRGGARVGAAPRGPAGHRGGAGRGRLARVPPRRGSAARAGRLLRRRLTGRARPGPSVARADSRVRAPNRRARWRRSRCSGSVPRPPTLPWPRVSSRATSRTRVSCPQTKRSIRLVPLAATGSRKPTSLEAFRSAAPPGCATPGLPARRDDRLRVPGRRPISRLPCPAHPVVSRCRLGQAHGRGTVVRDTHPSDTGPPVREACR